MKRLSNWYPTKLTTISFLSLTLVVSVIGFLGTRHIIQFLENRVIKHGIEHNIRILNAMVPQLTERLGSEADDDGFVAYFKHQADLASAFGTSMFLARTRDGIVVAGSTGTPSRERPDQNLSNWQIHNLNGDAYLSPMGWDGPGWVNTESGSIALINLQHLENPDTGARDWIIGISTDLGQLSGFLKDLHWHLDAVLFVTYGLIVLLGFITVRGFGRQYEQKLEQTVNRRTEELKDANREIVEKTRLATIGKTASVLSHEMRNPLSSLKFAISGFSQSDCLSKREQRQVEMVLGEVDRLEQMLSETLDYTRPVHIHGQPTTLDELLNRVLQLEQPQLKKHGLTLKRVRCADCPPLAIDQARITQALINLMKNAIEASKPGDRIDVVLTNDDDHQQLSITNPSDPLDDDVLQKAFDLFFTTKARGTGLGLGLVKRVIEEHGGSIRLRYLQGIGVRVIIRLPSTPPVQPAL